MKKLFSFILSVIGVFAFSVPALAQDGSGTHDAIEDGGYYYVYTMNGTSERAMTVLSSRLCWDVLERGNPSNIFKLEKAADNNAYYMQNLREGTWYWEITHYYFAEFKEGIENRAAMVFDPQDNDKTSFKIRPVKLRGDYKDEANYAEHGNFQCDASRNFATATSYFHSLGQWTGNTWYVEKVSDADLKAVQMRLALRKATQTLNDNMVFTLNNSPLLTNVPADCDPTTGLPGQIFTTCQQQDDKSSAFANLIDGVTTNNSKRFQSTWESSVTRPQYIQADVSADDVDGKQVAGIQLKIGLRPNGWGSAEFPIDITVYATNDATIAEDVEQTTIDKVAAQENWKWIGDYEFNTAQILTTTTGRWGQPQSNMITSKVPRWKTKDIVFPDGQKYRFIRFYVNRTPIPASDNYDFTICEFQLYELENPTASSTQADAIKTLRDLIAADFSKANAKTVTADDLTTIEAAIKAVTDSKSDALAQLQALVDSVKDANPTFTAGTTVGYNDSTAVANYNSAFNAAEAGAHATLSDADYNTLANNLRTSLEAAKNSLIPVSDGYYFIQSNYTAFPVTKAMLGVPNEDILEWEDYDPTNLAQVFKITNLGNEQYSIQNLVTQKYIGTIPGTSAEVKVTDKQETAQIIENIPGYAGQFRLYNTANSVNYHTEYHLSGMNSKGYVCTWSGDANSGSAWHLVEIKGAQLDSILSVAPQEQLKAIASLELDTAHTAFDNTFNFTRGSYLITNADDNAPDSCQWWTTCQEPTAEYSSYAHLIDGDLGTCFQSTWNAEVHGKPQWIQADLKDHPVKNFSLYYALRNGQWGAWEQWIKITVFATNEESVAKSTDIDTYDQVSARSEWKNVGTYNLPYNQSIRDFGGNNRSFIYDFNNTLDQNYRFIRFYVQEIYKTLNYPLGSFSVGELNLIENTYDEATAPYFNIDGLKEAADNLKAQENVVRAASEAGTLTQEQIDRLIELRKIVEGITNTKNNLQALYNTVSTYTGKFAAGEEYGDVTEAEYAAISSELTKAKELIDGKPSVADMQAETTALTEAYNTFKAAQKQFEPNKWYYISSRCNTRNGSIEKNGEGETAGTAHESSIYSTFCYGNVAYAPSDNTRAAQGGWGTNNRNALHWGYYVAGEEKGGAGGSALYTDNLDPHTMWRFVPIQGKDGQYAIQNRATGRFMSSYTGNSWVSLTTDTAAYVFEFLGSGVYKFRAAAASVYMQFAGDGYLYSYNADLDDPNGQVSFTLEPVETAENIVVEYPNNNSIFIKSLPYAISSDVVTLNADFATFYGIKGLEVVNGDSTLLLEKKTSVEAGEPFIAIAGDYTAFDAANLTTTTLVLPAVDEFNFEGKTVNGLTAAIDYTNAPKAGLGYFVDAALKATAKGTGIEGHTGYFDVKDMPLFTTTTEADQRIPLSGTGVDAIKSITAGTDGVVNVYSIDGKLLKKNVSGSKAAKGLKKGLYIVGKKKVTVK